MLINIKKLNEGTYELKGIANSENGSFGDNRQMTVQSAIELAASYFASVNLGTMNYGMTNKTLYFPLKLIMDKNPYFAQMYERYGNEVFNPEVTKNCGGPYYDLRMSYPTKYGSLDPNVAYEIVNRDDSEGPVVVISQSVPNPIAQAAVVANCLLTVGVFAPENPSTPAKVISWLRFIKSAVYNLTFDCTVTHDYSSSYPYKSYIDCYPVLELYYKADNSGEMKKVSVSNIDSISQVTGGGIVNLAMTRSGGSVTGIGLSGFTYNTDYTYYGTEFSTQYCVAGQNSVRETVGWYNTVNTGTTYKFPAATTVVSAYKAGTPPKFTTDAIPGGKSVQIEGEYYKTSTLVPVYIRFSGIHTSIASPVSGADISDVYWHSDDIF